MNGSSFVSASKTPVNSGMYSGVHLCGTLVPGTKCFRILEYSEGVFQVVFHEHVPRHRISGGNAFEFMKALLAGHRSLSSIDILRGYLNKRGKKPSAMEIGSAHTEFPEPGVLRKYLSYRDISILFDEVICADKFRGR